MKKRKLKLDELTIKSFVTDIDSAGKDTVQGGTSPALATVTAAIDAKLVLELLTISATVASIIETVKDMKYHPHPKPAKPGTPPDRISKVYLDSCNCVSQEPGSCFAGFCALPNQN